MEYQFFKTLVSEAASLIVNGEDSGFTVTEKRFVCTHPSVENSWRHGGSTPNATNNIPYEAVTIRMKTGETHEFVGDEKQDSCQKADEFLKNISAEY